MILFLILWPNILSPVKNVSLDNRVLSTANKMLSFEELFLEVEDVDEMDGLRLVKVSQTKLA